MSKREYAHGFAKRNLDDAPDAWQKTLRGQLLEQLGISSEMANIGKPGPSRLVKEDSYSNIHRTLVMADDGAGEEIPVYICESIARKPPRFALILLHGHNLNGKEDMFSAPENPVATQLISDVCAVGGLVAVPDVRGFGALMNERDRETGKANSCESMQRPLLMRGRTLLGRRVCDVSQLMSMLFEHYPTIGQDMHVVGFSGGATAALFSAACDDRVATCTVCSYFCTWEDSILAIPHCICNIVPGIAELANMYDIAGLIAPRKLRIIHGQQDAIFPIAGTKRAYRQLKEIFRAFQCEDRCALYVHDDGHVFVADGILPWIEQK